MTISDPSMISKSANLQNSRVFIYFILLIVHRLCTMKYVLKLYNAKCTKKCNNYQEQNQYTVKYTA